MNFNGKQKGHMTFKIKSCAIIAATLYKKGNNNVSCHCLTSSEILLILKECHDNMARGHFARDIIAAMFLQSDYWWPTLFSDCIM